MAKFSIPSMKGKVCIVTGANAGIGKPTAAALAAAGATTVLACRDEARGGAALEEIRDRLHEKLG